MITTRTQLLFFQEQEKGTEIPRKRRLPVANRIDLGKGCSEEKKSELERVESEKYSVGDIDILDTRIARQSLPTSPMFQSDPKRNQSKVSGPELNHDYISYSDIQIRYR
ncbi:hypothetical protein VNO77_46263 [Canavalia gladiata]|uniref:Uncharacterized protein n=1 Tax=Canavalia gladiata TaxID=3824 RepID=A0AAN9JCB6_CANGL